MTKNKSHGANYGIALLGIIIIIAVVYLVTKSAPTDKPIVHKPTDTQKAIDLKLTSTMTLKKQNDREIVAVGETFDIILSADSNKVPIVGYDAVINYDPEVVTFEVAKSILSQFEIIPTSKKGQIILTGILNEKATPNGFDNTPLALVSFSAKNQGDSKISLVIDKQSNRTDSNIIDKKSNDLLGKVVNQRVIVGDKVTIVSKDDVKVGDSVIALENAQIPDGQCVDCQTNIKLRVTKGTSTERLNFVSGGIGGVVMTPQVAFGQLYELGDVSPASIVVYYAGVVE